MKKPKKTQPAKKASNSAVAIYRALLGRALQHRLVARYDALNRMDTTRRFPIIKTGATVTEQWFTSDKRLLAYAECDSLSDNSAVGSILDIACRLSIGDKLTPVFTGDDGEFWQLLWNNWAKKCGFDEDEDWHTMLGIVLRAVLKHGDCFLCLDESITGGKLRIWDADQCTNISDFQQWLADRGAPATWRCVEGVVLSEEGRVQGYFLTSLRNRQGVDSSEAIYLPREMCLRLSLKRKITEVRGEPTAILRQEQVAQDSNDLLKSEIASGKLTSELSLIVEQGADGDPSGLGGILEGLPEDEKEEALGEAGITDSDLEQLKEVAMDSKTFQAFGDKASLVQVPSGTKVTNLTPQRPSNQMMSWQGMLDTSVGKSLGMMSCLSNGRADNSFSSGEIELEISWTAFQEYARMLSRLVDFCAERICPHQPYEICYTSPISIDSEKEEKVLTMRLQSGRSTYREQLGPNYKRKLEQLASEKKMLDEMGLSNLAPFSQTISGAVIPDEEGNDKEETDL